MRILQLLPEGKANRRIIGGVIVLLIVAGLFSPLFDLTHIHGVASPKLYFQHFYLDAVAGLGGYLAASFCSHRWHRVLLMLGIDILVTFCLVTIVG